ncbi:apolipoprotein N-acyltransferase [candidate division WOR-3 bacterium]|nr:apolipoprotein N-acyltransferase [candidate division WOR-3 bacterium]
MIKKFLLFFVIPVLMFFSFQPINLWFLFIPAYAAFLLLIKDLSFKKRFLYSFISFAVFWFISMHWISLINVGFPGYQRVLIALGLIVLSAGLSFIWIIPVIFINPRSKQIYLLPIIVAGIEFLASIENNTAFQWLSPSQTMLSFLPAIQIADIGGMYLVTLFVILCSVLIFRIFTCSKKGVIINLIILLVIAVTVISYGNYRLNEARYGEKMKIAFVQPNIPASIKGYFYKGTDQRIRVLTKYLEELRNSDCEIIIFPETAAPVYLQRNNHFSRYVKKFVESTGKGILMGSLRIKYGKDRRAFDYYNSVYFIKPGSMEYYDKIRPLGFAERLPYDDKWRFLRNIPFGQGDLTPGNEFKKFEYNGKIFSAYICFESAFAPLVSRFVREGAEFIINVSEDAWFFRSIGPYQHFYSGLLRSVENRRYLIRASNPGISAVIDPCGRIVLKKALFDQGNSEYEITLYNDLTFYTRFDNLLPKIFLLISLLFIFYTIIRKILLLKKTSH